jgi:hypothetical protein
VYLPGAGITRVPVNKLDAVCPLCHPPADAERDEGARHSEYTAENSEPPGAAHLDSQGGKKQVQDEADREYNQKVGGEKETYSFKHATPPKSLIFSMFSGCMDETFHTEQERISGDFHAVVYVFTPGFLLQPFFSVISGLTNELLAVSSKKLPP